MKDSQTKYSVKAVQAIPTRIKVVITKYLYFFSNVPIIILFNSLV